MPSIATLFTPLALLLLTSAAPARLDERGSRERGEKRGCRRTEAAAVASSSSSIYSSSPVSSMEMSTTSVSIPPPSEAPTDTQNDVALPTVNEAFGLSVCIGAGMDCNKSPTTAATPPTTAAGTPPTTSAVPPTSIASPPASSAPPTSIAAPATSASTSGAVTAPSGGSSGGDKYVFAHFMVGIVGSYTQADHEADQRLAKAKGIDGYAMNIGVDAYSVPQLDLAYAAAQKVGGFKLFISFDFNWYSTGDVTGVAGVLARYVNNPAQLQVDGKAFVSSFIGDGFDWAACAQQVGTEIYAVPYFQPSQANAQNPGLSGSFSWDAWPGQLDNVPVKENMTTSQDENYLSFLNAAGKQYMAPVSPWFNTHFGKEVSYSKNWLFYSEDLWKTRWDQILELGQQGVNFVEIVTWNDYGESHHIGPFDTPHTDDGASLWASGLNHLPMLDFAVPYIQAFKAGLAAPVVTQEYMVFWHRPHLKDAECDSTDNCGSKPTGWDFVEDAVFVTTFTKNGGQVTVTSGDNDAFTQQVDGGVQIFQVPMGVGKQSFSLKTSAGATMQGASNITVTDTCWNGIYNFNFHSGTISPD